MLAQAYLASNKLADATAAVDRARGLQRVNVETRLMGATIAARLAERQSAKDAVAQLQTVIDEATRRGYVRKELNARLWQAEIELRAGQRERGRAHLAAVKRDALARGFVAVGRRAQAALDGGPR